MYILVLRLFYSLFYTLEDNGWLDKVDLLGLHYVFVPSINCQLGKF